MYCTFLIYAVRSNTLSKPPRLVIQPLILSRLSYSRRNSHHSGGRQDSYSKDSQLKEVEVEVRTT